MDEQGFQGFGAFGRSVLRLALVRDQDVREPQTQFLGELWQGGDVGCHETLTQHNVAEQTAFRCVGEGSLVPGQLTYLAHVVEDGAKDEQVAVYGVEFGQLACDPQAIYRVLEQAPDPGVVHRLGRRGFAVRVPEILIRDHLLEEGSQVFVFELTSSAFELRGEGPPIQLRGREVVFLGDVLRPQETNTLELHLQGSAVLVGVSLDVDVEWVVCLTEELLGEFTPHAGVHRAGTVDQLEGEVGHAAAVLADRRVRGEEAGAQPGARLQIARPELLFIQGGSLLVLPLHGPCRKPRDDAALEDKDQYHERHRHHHRCCGLGTVVYGVERGEIRYHDRHRLGALVEEERVGEQELVPGENERQDGRREYPRRRERHDDFAERLYRRRPVNLGRILEVDGQLPEERHKEPDRQRQGEDRVGDDH